MASADVPPGPEVLTLGPEPARRPPGRRVVLVLLVAVLLLTGGGVAAWWQLRERPTNDLTFADLQDVYAGMVRDDGTNDSAVLARDQPRPTPPAVSPESCRPLVDSTLADQFPPDALDGVSTYWLGEGAASAISLFTLRYPDPATAVGRYQAIADALTACDQGPVTVGSTSGRVTATTVSHDNGVRSQLGYLVTQTTGDRYAIAVLQYENTITWQFRLEVGRGEYEPYAAQQLMDSLMTQVRSIQELRRR